MTPRIDFAKAAPAAASAMYALSAYVSRSSGLEASLLELLKLRASQINGCACRIDMHSKDARGRRNRAAFVRARRLA